MSLRFSISIARVVELLGLYRDPRAPMNAPSFNVQCPFCNDKKWHLNINTAQETYRCPLCGSGGGALDLYGRVAHGTPCVTGPNGNSKTLYRKLCDDLNLGSPKSVATAPRKEAPKGISRAEDSVVHNTYRMMLSMLEFRLSDKHRNNLLERGLSEEAIRRNGYSSFRLEAVQDTLTSKEVEIAYRKELRAIKKTMPVIGNYGDKRIIAGLEIARRLARIRCQFEGVPGFFKLGEYWCFRVEDGMYIPTRNMKGEIVAVQVRKDDGDVRYKTISSKDLPGGVSVNITRTHFPLGNAPLSEKPKVLLTEGPLKADVALELMEPDRCAFMAIHGVRNTAELGMLFQELRQQGIEKVVNALDMDRLTNPHVGLASRDIRRLAKEQGLTMSQLFWGKSFAEAKAAELEALCRANNVCVPEGANVYLRVGQMTAALHQEDVALSHGWESRTKGLDDYLLHKRKQIF